MIFITTGSQKFQFNRLLKEIDRLIEAGNITEKVFAQIGYSDYQPVHFEYCDFLNREQFAEKMHESTIVITHGGTGAIISAVKRGKKVIAVPRLKEFGEHVDDHQIQLLNQFDGMNLICACYKTEEIQEALAGINEKEFRTYESNTQAILDDIEAFLLNI